jgi:Na+/phosphate symporter
LIKLKPRIKLEDIRYYARVKRLIQQINWGKVLLFLLSLWLFILAITLMKEGARDLAPIIRTTFSVENVASSLGFGWLFAYGVMSGSPVAAAALTFFDAGAIANVDAFAMITGSRLGASLIVLLIGFIYVLRGRGRSESLGMGLLSLTVTGSTYLVAFAVGYFILISGRLDWVQFRSGVLLSSVIDGLFYPIVDQLTLYLPGWMLFVIGMLVILLSFSLFDRCLPTMSLKQSQFGRVSRLVYRPVVMLLLGAFVTLLSMSVSVSLSILVPLSNRGFVRRENVIPYIMGANITTFIDTLLAAVLLRNPQAFTVVFVEMISIAIVSGLILAFFFSRYEHMVLTFVDWLIHSNRNLAIFIGTIFLVPVLLLLL